MKIITKFFFSLILKKAFYSVEWNFIFETLKRFNFGDNFLSWIFILYNEPKFRLKNNGWITKTCSMNRGIRQGCPVSAIIFLFVTEILSLTIVENKEIAGFKTQYMTKEIKLIQHADDATLPLRDKQSLKAALKCINSFGTISGMSLNIDKTECMLLGDLKGTENTIHGIKINFDCTKVLGTYIGHNKEKCIEKN